MALKLTMAGNYRAVGRRPGPSETTRERRSTRGKGRRVKRHGQRTVDSSLSDPPLKNYEARHQPSECGVGVDHGAKLAQSPVCAPADPPDETLYELGDGSNLPTIDVRADVPPAEPQA